MITRKEFRKAVVNAALAYQNDECDDIVINGRIYGNYNGFGTSLGRTWVRYRGMLIRNMTSRAYRDDKHLYPLRREWAETLRIERKKGQVRIP